MTTAKTSDHPDLANRRRRLICTCCGSGYSGRQFDNQDTGYSLGDCCVDFVRPRVDDMERTYGVPGVHYLANPIAKVRTIDAPDSWSDWHIAQNLTDRWGEINHAEPEQKLVLRFLESDPELLERLRAQMFEEDTFIVNKGGRWGILFELEYCSRESEANTVGEEGAKAFEPQTDVERRLLRGMKAIADTFPGVDFAVPGSGHTYEDRPSAWAFVPDGLLDDNARTTLGRALQSLGRGSQKSTESNCSDCGQSVGSIVGCPDGAEVCQPCFESGAH